MIKNILFDFDGVILDSMKIKGDGFIELFKEYPKNTLQALETYHYANGGVSRFAKIRHFFNDILGSPISEKEINILAERFAQIITEKLFDKNNLIDETINFIQENFTLHNCHIVSGAEHQELNTLCEHLAISRYFKSIQGSPTPKTKLVYTLLQTYRYGQEETILVGDSLNDYQAAKENGIHFYGYNNDLVRSCEYYIETFKGFKP